MIRGNADTAVGIADWLLSHASLGMRATTVPVGMSILALFTSHFPDLEMHLSILLLGVG